MQYIKCPECELNYIDADKQNICNVCLDKLAEKAKSHKRGETVKPVVKEPLRYNGRAVFFVFQNKEFQDEFYAGIIKAPYYDKGMNEPHHWKRLSIVKQGDIILHGVNGCIIAISIAQGPSYDFIYPDGSQGRKVDCKYHLLKAPLVTNKYKEEIKENCIKYKYQPFNKNGKGVDGYLFDLCREIATLFISDIAVHNLEIGTLLSVKDI